MVRKFLASMQREVRGLHEAAYVLAVFTFLSQVLALIRDRVFAHFFGAGAFLDAYFAAFRIPDISFAVLTLFASSFALVPLITERGGAGTKEARTLLSGVFVVFGVVSVVASAALWFLLPTLLPLIVPGFSDEVRATTLELSRIMLLQPILLGISTIASSVMQASRKFFLYALAPIFYNVGIIVGALFLYPTLGSVGLAWGVVLGASLHLLVQATPFITSPQGLHVSRSLVRDMTKIMFLSAPRALALSSQQFLFIAFAVAASVTAAGSVAVVSFAWNLQSVPLAIIGVSYASALFPSLSALFVAGNRETFVREMWIAVRHMLMWTMLAIALMIVLRAHIVRVILGTGAFTWSDTRLTAAVLAGFVISLAAQAALLIFSRAYYAAGKSLTPIAINVGAAVLAGVFGLVATSWFQTATTTRYFFEGLFKIGGIAGSDMLILALTYSAVMVASALVFAIHAAKTFGFEPKTIQSLSYSFAASVLAAAGCYATLRLFGPLLPTDTFFGILAQGVSGGVVGLLVWAGTLSLLKSKEFSEVISVLVKMRKPSVS